MSNQDPRPLLENEDPINVRNPAAQFVDIANRATTLIHTFLAQNPQQGDTQTQAEKDRLMAAYEAIPLGDVRAAYEAAMDMNMEAATNEERANKRRVRPAIEGFRKATIQAARLLERKVVGGGGRRATRRRGRKITRRARKITRRR
jgi:hypothetical protein